MRSLFIFKKFVIAIGLLLGFLLFITTTNAGLELIFMVVKNILPGHFQVQTVKGKLISDINIENISYHNKNIQIDIHSLYLSWDAFYLVKKKLIIKNLLIDDITVQQKNSNTQDSNTEDKVNSIAWLKYLAIQQVKINNLIYSNQNKLIKLQEITLTKNISNDAQHFSITSPYGNLNGLVELSIAPVLSWKLTLEGRKINPEDIFPTWKGLINLTLKSQGIWLPHDQNIQVELVNLSGDLKNLPIQGIASFAYRNGNLKISKTKISVLNANVNIEGELSDSFAIHWQANIPSLNLFSSVIKGAITTSGDLTGKKDNPILQMSTMVNHFNVNNFEVEAISAKIATSLSSNEIIMHLIGDNLKFQDYRVPKVNIDTVLKKSNEKLITDSLISLNENNKITAHVDFPSWQLLNDFSRPIAAKINLNFKQLAELVKTSAVNEIKGNVVGSADITGSLNKPMIHLSAQLNNGNIYIKKAHMGFNSVFLKTEYNSNQIIVVNGTFLLGKGKGDLSGNINFNKPGFPASLTVNGNAMQVKDSDEYKIIFSPHLNLLYEDKKINIQGKIAIASAEITPHDFSQVTTLPNEVVIVGAKKSDQFSIPNLKMNVEINLDKIKLQYQNLDSILNGSLNISQSSNGLPIAVGSLNIISGHYKMYGRNLDINLGRLVYTGGALTNPSFDIRATQRFEKVTFAENQNQFNNSKQLQTSYAGTSKLIIGVLIKGSVTQPKVIFFSEPSGVSQNDILSYLAFGVPRSQVSGANALALLNSLASSSFSNNSNMSVDGLTKSIENKLKLTELSLGSTEVYDANKNVTEQTTTVNIARQLGSKFSISYKAGVFTPVSILNLQYKINNHFSIQTETSNFESGANLLYEIETD